MSQHLLKTLLALVLALFSLNVMAFNWGIVWGGLFLKKKMPSFIPFVGGVTGLYALKLAPWESVHAYWWVPPVVDVGCVLYLLCAVVSLLLEKTRPTPKDPL